MSLHVSSKTPKKKKIILPKENRVLEISNGRFSTKITAITTIVEINLTIVLKNDRNS